MTGEVVCVKAKLLPALHYGAIRLSTNRSVAKASAGLLP